MKLSPVRALITGGAGFLGSGLVDRLLAEGHGVEVVDDLSSGSLANLKDARAHRGNLRFHQLDVCAPACVELVGRLKPDVIFHLAAPPEEEGGFEDPARHSEVALVGLWRLLEGARVAGTRKVVFASSWRCYGDLEPDELPAREHRATRPQTPAGVAKRAALDALATYREHHGVEFSALALASVYGPRQLPAASPVAALAQALVVGGTWAVPSGPSVTRDFLYVDDAVDALARAAERGSGLLINVGSGEETSFAALGECAARLVGAPVRLRRAPAAPGTPARCALDASRAGIHLGWRPFTPLEDGMAAMLAAARRSVATASVTPS